MQKTEQKSKIKKLPRGEHDKVSSEIPYMEMSLRNGIIRDIKLAAKADTIGEVRDSMEYLLKKTMEIEKWVTVVDKGRKIDPFIDFEQGDEE